MDVPLLVVSCDRYADLWGPFFTVFWRRWPDCPFPVHLGSNTKTHPDRRVLPLLVGGDDGWTVCVLRMLDRLGASHVILFLEDFLIRRPVDTEAVRALVGIAAGSGAGCVRLAPLPPPTPLPSVPVPGSPGLGIVAPGTPYRVSAQPAVWRVETLRRLLVPGFSAWDFEHLGSKMSDGFPEPFWGPFEPSVDYVNGVEKGMWTPEGLSVCRDAGADVDLSARGAFTGEELAAHFARGEEESRLDAIKQSALSSFLAGRRLDGLRSAAAFLRRRPLSAQGWGITAFGLLGPRPLAWLRSGHLRMRIARLRRARGQGGGA